MKRLSLLAVSMLLTCTLFAADIFLRGSVNGWGASDDFKFATSDNVVYTLEKSFDLFGEFKFGDANWGADNYGSGGGAVELDTPLKLAPGGGNFNCGSNSYKVTKIVLNLLENSATIYGEGGELEITSWTVCGSAAVMGSEFDPTDTSNDMVFVGGVYQLQKKSVALAADAIYEYKFTGNHAWGVGQYPESMENLEFTVSADGTYNVTFSWNPATKKYGVVPESVTPPTPPVDFDTYILVGDAALFYVDWTPSPIGVDRFTLETTDGINYSKSVNNVPISKAGTFAYGFSKNGSTTDILFKDKTKTVTIEEAGTYNVSVSLIVAPGEKPDAEAILTKVVEPKYYIAGNGDATTDWCCGKNWDEKGCPMEAGYFTRDLPAGTYMFKITDGTWDKNWGYDAVDPSQSTPGYDTDTDGNVVFTLAEYSTVAVNFDGSKIALQWIKKDEPVVFDTWTLVGDMPPFPAAWDATMTAFDLQTTDGVIYTLVADDVDMPVETFQYGFRKNHTEEYAPLEEKYKVSLAEGVGNYKVQITLDFTDATNPQVDVKFTKNVTPTYDYYIAGDGSAETGWTCGLFWQADGCGMADGAYAAKVPAGTYSFKVTQGDWDKDSFGYESVDATASTPGYVNAGGNVQFTVSAEANIGVTFNGTAIVLTSDVPFGEATIKTWTIAGQEELMGVFWDPKVESNDMAKDGDVYKLTRSNVSLAAGEYQYKACANHSWNIATVPADDSNMILAIDEDGVYTVVFTLDADKAKLSATATKQVVVFDTWTLVGDMPPFPAAWTVEPAFDLQTTDGVVYTLVADDVDMTVDKFQYGFRKNHTEDFAPLEAKYTATLAEGTGSYKVEITIDFSATPVVPQVEFTKNPEPPVGGITVNVTVPANTPACFFYGEMSGNTFVEMTKVDDTHYTTKFADKESIGWGYLFCWESGNFSTKNTGGDFTDEPVDGVINVEVVGWETEPGTEYKYTTYTDWQVRTDWNGSWDPETWLTLTPNVDGTFSGLGEWGTGEGVNLASNDGPVKKNWYAANDPDITIEPGLEVGTQVRFTLTVISDDNVNILVENANPTSADEAVEDSIYATNGTVFCSTPFEVYNLVGQNVTAQNGSLFGIYIVKTANTVKTVSVK